MAEEQRCQEAHCLYANNYGFFGSPATQNLCSKCYRDFSMEEQASSAKIVVDRSLQASPSSVIVTNLPIADITLASTAVGRAKGTSSANRCSACGKKV